VAFGHPLFKGVVEVKLRERLEKAAFDRDLRRAQKRFLIVAAKAERMRMPKKEKRSLLKLMLRAAGYKRIRLMERD
jgi:hypothetical protein